MYGVISGLPIQKKTWYLYIVIETSNPWKLYLLERIPPRCQFPEANVGNTSIIRVLIDDLALHMADQYIGPNTT